VTAAATNGPDQGRQLILLEEDQPTTVAPISLQQRRDRILIVVFLVITAAAALYNFVIATPRYGSEFSYVVRSLDSSRERFSFLNISTNGGGADNSEAIVAYIQSRDMLEAINQDGLIARAFAAPQIDMFNAFPALLAGKTREDFYQHVQGYIDADFDHQSNITYVRVEAFSAEDAREISERVMQASERMVNSLNARARQNLLAAAQKEVETASRSLRDVLDRLNTVRGRSRILEPKLEGGAAIKVSSASAAALAQINVELAQTLSVAPDSPLIGQLRARRSALEAEVLRQNAAIAGNPGSLADRIRPYEELTVERDIAEKHLLAASLGFAGARASVDRSRFYVERISQPNLPDIARYPRGLLNLLAVMLVAAAVLFVVRALSDLVLDDDG
jgi:BexC/CtrB/KpsE family polysaccharide export inner-membrane protein